VESFAARICEFSRSFDIQISRYSRNDKEPELLRIIFVNSDDLHPTKFAPKGAKFLMVSKMPDMKKSSGMGRVKVEPL